MFAHARTLEGGLADPVLDAQAVFRTVMDAMSRPATILVMPRGTTPPAPLGAAAGAMAATLADAETPIWLDSPLAGSEAVRAWLTFHTGARFAAAPPEASFGLVSDPARLPPLGLFAQGTQDYPDRSTTLILQVESLDGGAALTFRGPGIKGTATIAPVGLPGDFADEWMDNASRFPRGVDLVLIAGDLIACLPRSARLVLGG
jgi:alpha-D-ribose 1-methylphosphonate 5-triphosphate synthase subunit PhnH